MRRSTVLFILFLIFAFHSCSIVEERLLVGLLDDYIAAQEALAEDKYEEAKTALEALASESEGDLESLSEKAAASIDIDQMREAFRPLSDEVIKRDLPDGYFVARCPHGEDGKDVFWVQQGEEIMNPYHGSSLRDCGTLEKGTVVD